MRTDQVQTETNWTSLKGTVLSGGYELQDFLEGDSSSASFKVRVLGDRFLQATAKFFHLESGKIEGQLAVWEAARLLRHPNLLGPLGSGQAEDAARSLVYIVVTRADESLGSVVPERALTPEEAGDVLTAAVRGLSELHAQGYVHGCISPEQILAVGDLIKLPTDCIRPAGEAPAVTVRSARYRAPESVAENATPAADVWCLGATLFETLTQRPASEASRDEASKLPAPFQHVIRECLNPDPGSRCSLNDALAIYRGELIPRAVAPAPRVEPTAPAEPAVRVDPLPRVEAASEASPKAEPNTAPPIKAIETAAVPEVQKASPPPTESSPSANIAEPSVALRLPVEPVTASVPPPPPVEAKPQATGPPPRRTDARYAVEEKRPRNRWIVWASVAGLVLIVILVLRARTSKPVGPPVVASQKIAPAQPPGNSWETKSFPPEGNAAKLTPRAPTAAPRTMKPAPVAPEKNDRGTVNGPIWRVVLFTYTKSEDAERKVHAESAQHPDLQFEVFSPSGHGGPYLVVAGGRMTRDQAVQLRRKAISMGYPHDAYIQNYKR
jgi:hypothetical protein